VNQILHRAANKYFEPKVVVTPYEIIPRGLSFTTAHQREIKSPEVHVRHVCTRQRKLLDIGCPQMAAPIVWLGFPRGQFHKSEGL